MRYNNVFIFSLVFILVFQVSIISATINYKFNNETVFTIDENARGEGSFSILDLTVRNGTIINLSSVFLLDQTLNFFSSPGNISMIVNGNSTDGLAAIISKGQNPIGSTSFIGDVDNFDDFNGFSRFRETNINNGTSASAGFIAENDVGFEISIGIASSNFLLDNLSIPNIGALRLGSPAEMIFLNDFINGWVWISDLNNSAGFQEAFTAMDLDPNGDLNVTGNLTISEKITFTLGEMIDNIVDGWIKITGNFNVTGDATIGGDLNVAGTVFAEDVNSQGLFNRIDNATQINSDVIFNQTLPVLYAADTTNNEITINITFGTNASFQVWDAERKFQINGVFVNVLNPDGVTIDHLVELNTRNKAFQFFFNGTFWLYGEIGNGQFVSISSNHTSIDDFGNLIQQNNNNSEITIIGDLNVTGDYINNGSIGFTGTCINTTYSGGIAVGCND